MFPIAFSKTALVCGAIVFALSATASRAAEVAIPLTVSPPMVRDALIEQVFSEPGKRVTFWSEACSFFYLEDPQVEGRDGTLRVTAHGEARVGTDVLGNCLSPIAWSGNLELFERPQMQGWEVHFEVADSNVYDERWQKALLTGQLWDRMKQSVHPRLGALKIDLGTPFQELRETLPLFLGKEDTEQAQRILASLRPARASATPEGIKVDAVIDVATPAAPATPEPEPPLTEAEVQSFARRLDEWDAFVTFAIRELGQRALRPDTRDRLLSVLIETRYEILKALQSPDRGADPVRRLFVSAWDQLRPVAAEVAHELPGAEGLRVFLFLASGDVLVALDRIGPALGVDVSADGLRRMARLMEPDLAKDPLEYAPYFDPKLRSFLGFGRTPEVEEEKPDDGSWWWPLSPRSAWAGPAGAESAWKGWFFSKRAEVDGYVEKVAKLLGETVKAKKQENRLEGHTGKLYERLLPATAWQESCWRQFHERAGKVTYLRSPFASVGILQVNERVWRGFYEVDRLRWDIRYNMVAGAEILLRYFRMVLRQRPAYAESGAPEAARAVYAAYNGGPGQLRRYLGGKAGPKLKRVIDGLFGRKFGTEPKDVPAEVARCLVGG